MMEQLLEYFGVLTGLLYLFLEIRQHRAMWVIGFLTSLVYVFVFFFSKIYADMGLNIYYVAISIYGFWQWTRSKGRQEQTTEDIETAPQEVILYRNMTLRLFAGISFSIVALFALLYYVLHYFTDSPIPAGDGFTSESSPPGCWHAGSSSTGSSGSSSTAYPSIFITCVGSIPQCFSIFATPYWRQPDYTLGKRKE